MNEFKPIHVVRSYQDGDSSVKYYHEEDVQRLLAEQHRNTRHDAIEFLMDLYSNGNGTIQTLVEELDKGIMNLKQRSPL
ncbi:MAG TPA: hypothetical protein VGK47_14190 [Nitrososphaeraceae archaeon]